MVGRTVWKGLIIQGVEKQEFTQYNFKKHILSFFQQVTYEMLKSSPYLTLLQIKVSFLGQQFQAEKRTNSKTKESFMRRFLKLLLITSAKVFLRLYFLF